MVVPIPTLPVVTIFCAQKLGEIFVPAIAAFVATFGLVIALSTIIGEVILTLEIRLKSKFPVLILLASRFGIRAVSKVHEVICDAGRFGIRAVSKVHEVIWDAGRFGMRAVSKVHEVILVAGRSATKIGRIVPLL